MKEEERRDSDEMEHIRAAEDMSDKGTETEVRDIQRHRQKAHKKIGGRGKIRSIDQRTGVVSCRVDVYVKSNMLSLKRLQREY